MDKSRKIRPVYLYPDTESFKESSESTVLLTDDRGGTPLVLTRVDVAMDTTHTAVFNMACLEHNRHQPLTAEFKVRCARAFYRELPFRRRNPSAR